jgi:hypothetical protein
MISPFPGAVFTTAGDGDQRADPAARARAAASAGISSHWATVRQVHGSRVVEVEAAGEQGEGDALFTRRPGLPLAVFTADCLGVVLAAAGGVGVAHAGWRGLAGGVVEALVEEMAAAGLPPVRAAIGPAIGACCYEVGAEVAERFPAHTRWTTWGAASVDLTAAARTALAGIPVESVGSCTRHEAGWFSHRRDATAARLAAIGWLPGEPA